LLGVRGMNSSLRMIGRFAITCSLALLIQGCGGSNGVAQGKGGGPIGVGTSVEGTYGGKPLTVADAVTTSYKDGIWVTATVLSPTPNLCGQLQQGQATPSTRRLDVNLYSADDVVVPGTYTITAKPPYTPPSMLTARIRIYDFDSQCLAGDSNWAVSGTVVIESVQEGALQGTFDTQFFNGDKLKGSFASTACAAADGPIRPITCAP
jgi:hypothetical protein